MPEQKLEISEDVVNDVVAALNMAIGIAMHKAPDCVAKLSAAAMRFDEAINDALATEP